MPGAGFTGCGLYLKLAGKMSPPETGAGFTLSPPETGVGFTLSPPEKGQTS